MLPRFSEVDTSKKKPLCRPCCLDFQRLIRTKRNLFLEVLSNFVSHSVHSVHLHRFRIGAKFNRSKSKGLKAKTNTYVYRVGVSNTSKQVILFLDL